jgi:aarF domain-containing kinase
LKNDDVYIPEVRWPYSSKRILTTEWIDGVKLNNAPALKQFGFNQEKVIQTTVELFADQIFLSGLVHADPHPGNVLVRRHPRKPKQHQVVLLDHGLYLQESEKFR